MTSLSKRNHVLVKYFHFIIHNDVSIAKLKVAIEDVLGKPIAVTEYDNKMGYFAVDGELIDELINTISVLIYDVGISATFLVSHSYNKLTYYSLLNCIQFGVNCIHYLSDIIMLLMFNGDVRVKEMLLEEFKEVDREIINTANEFLKSGLNANKASQKLYLHRNTLSYRLQKFIFRTNLDIRDYYNAQVLYIYFIAIR